MEWSKKIFVVCITLMMTSLTYGQIALGKYWISFTDKENNGYSVSDPQAFLSERAIERRANQNIPVVSNDMPVTQSYVDQVDDFDGVSIIYTSKWFNAVAIEMEDPLELTGILNLPFVSGFKSVRASKEKHREIVEEKSTRNADKIVLPEYGPSFNQINLFNGIPLHDAGFEGDGMLIGVCDGGFRSVDILDAFQHLFDADRIVGTKDFVEGDEDVYNIDVSSHGTYVLSCMGGIIQDSLYGVATEASYVLMRTEDTGSELVVEEFNWIAAAEYADSLGVDILTTSLSYTLFDEEEMNYEYADLNGDTSWITQAGDVAVSKGILVVNSAGNSGAQPWHFVGMPADGDSIMAVGAVNFEGVHSSFSSFGPSADGRVKPNVMAKGSQVTVTDFDNTIRTISGTSFSCPLTSGMASCLWQMHPTATNMEVFNAIQESASLYTTPNDSMGYGIPDFWEAHLILEEWLSVNEIVGNEPFSIYPNPVQDQLQIVFQQAEDWEELAIYDVTGKEVMSLVPNVDAQSRLTIPVSGLNSGLYFAVLRKKGESQSIKWTKL